MRSRPRLWSLLTLTLCGALAGSAISCQRGPSQIGASETPAIPVAQPAEKEILDFVDFTGRTDAVESVNIVARVTGFLVKMPFREGSEVKARELLFEVDPRPYQAQYDQAQSQVSLSQAQLDLAQKTLDRFLALKKETPGAVSDQAIDQYKAAVVEAQSRVTASQKSLEVYRLNKEFTRVESPIHGQVSRYYLTLGNLVNQDQTLLTTVVSLDPMYAYFDMDERTLLRIRRLTNEGKIKPRGQRSGREHTITALVAGQGILAPGSVGPQLAPAMLAAAVAVLEPDFPVFMGLQGEDGFPHAGYINFSNNQVNPGTGSISVRGVFTNEKPANGVRLLSPGMFVRIRLPIGQPHQAILVIDRAIQSDQGKKFVYVVDSDNKVETRPVTTGALQTDGLRVILSGLAPDEWVVVGGLQQVRPGLEVKTDPRKKMPSFGDSGEDGGAGSGSAGDKGR